MDFLYSLYIVIHKSCSNIRKIFSSHQVYAYLTNQGAYFSFATHIGNWEMSWDWRLNIGHHHWSHHDIILLAIIQCFPQPAYSHHIIWTSGPELWSQNEPPKLMIYNIIRLIAIPTNCRQSTESNSLTYVLPLAPQNTIMARSVCNHFLCLPSMSAYNEDRNLYNRVIPGINHTYK